MNTILAFAMGEATRDRESMVFDWDKAAEIIRIKNPVKAYAGLRDDWEWTGGKIYENGRPVMDSYTFLASTWAVPELSIDDVEIPCYRMESETPGWGSDTKWPRSAIEILEGEE